MPLHHTFHSLCACRCVLAASSPVWASLLSSAGALVELRASCLTDIVLVHVVDYIYTGSLPADRSQQEWSALLAAASYLQMDGLLEALQTSAKSADDRSVSTPSREHLSCKRDNSNEANVADVCRQLSSTCSVNSPERENQHSENVGLVENRGLGGSGFVAGGCRQMPSRTPCNTGQRISTAAAWQRISEEDIDGWENRTHSADRRQARKDRLPLNSDSDRSLLGKDDRETSEDEHLPPGAKETTHPRIFRSKFLKGTTQRGQRWSSTLQLDEDFPISSTLFKQKSSSATSPPCSGAVPVIRHSSAANVNAAVLPRPPHPVTAAGCSEASPSGSRDNNQSAVSLKDERNDHLVNRRGNTEALARNAQEDELYKPNGRDHSCCTQDSGRYWDRLGTTEDHINHCCSFENVLQHFNTDSMARANTPGNPFGHSSDAQSSHESGTRDFSHSEKFGPESEIVEKVSDSHVSPAGSNEQHRHCHPSGDWNTHARLYRGDKSFSSTVCVQLDTDTGPTADAGTVRESPERGNISGHSPSSDVDSGVLAHSYHGHVHYHCLSPNGSHFHPRHSNQHTESWSQQDSGFIPCRAPSPPVQPLATMEQVVLLDISTKSPELLVSCTSDKTGSCLAFGQTDTSSQNTAAGHWNIENQSSALRISFSPGVPDYVKAPSSSSLSVCVPSVVPASVPTNASEQPSTPLHHPFQCSMCERSFSQRGSLNRHVRSHLGIRPFPCPRCPMTFSRQYRVTEHMRVHQRSVPECDFPKTSARPI